MKGKIERGFIGWFDILGYKSLFETLELADVLSIINAQQKARESNFEWIKEIAGELPETETRGKAAIDEVLQNTSWLTFSDTTVVALTIPKLDNDYMRFVRIGVFLELVISTHIGFFGKGLPLRGAISFGDYYLDRENSLFAGKPLLEAHKWAEGQKWSGCVMTPSGISAFFQIMNQMPKNIRKVMLTYVMQFPVTCPDNGSTENTPESMFCLNWPRNVDRLLECNNVRDFVERQFARHNKPISFPGIQEKIENTTKFMKQSRPEWK